MPRRRPVAKCSSHRELSWAAWQVLMPTKPQGAGGPWAEPTIKAQGTSPVQPTEKAVSFTPPPGQPHHG